MSELLDSEASGSNTVSTSIITFGMGVFEWRVPRRPVTVITSLLVLTVSFNGEYPTPERVTERGFPIGVSRDKSLDHVGSTFVNFHRRFR